MPGNEKNRLVYVVDDEERNLLLVEKALSTAGYNIRKFHDGQEVLDGVREEIPDIIVLDVMMPRMDGYTVCETLKKEKTTQIIPIILVTGLEDMRDKVRGLEAGADDFITKPFHPMELRARVKSLLRIKSLTDELEEKNLLLADENLRG
ncbi:MAG: response regulator, partial [Deltaproteobacteria bacterium]|nr:response regulator [Deltaproteobacteria bacterium]